MGAVVDDDEDFSAGGGEPMAVGAPRDGVDLVVKPAEVRRILAGDGIPDFHGAVGTPGGDSAAVRAPVDAGDGARVPAELLGHLETCRVPETNAPIRPPG